MTPQYSGLESMYKKYKDQGLKVLAFPANNFGNQEPGTNAEIKEFCSTKYNVTFDVFAKLSVAGEDQSPLYKYLTEHSDEKIAGKVQWNFQKYLVGREGTVLAKWGPRTAPDDNELVEKVEAALKAPKPAAAPKPGS
jgi:glutathione peroxidase